MTEFSQNVRTQYLVRHGHSQANQENLIVGHPEHGIHNYGLTPKGKEQAHAAASKLKLRIKNPIIFSSDFLRAKETAAIIQEKLGCELKFLPEIRERNFGKLEFKNSSNYQMVWDADASNPGKSIQKVESLLAIFNRISRAWEKNTPLANEREIIWVSHGDPLKVMQCFFFNLSLRCCHDIQTLQCGDLKVTKTRKPITIAAHRGNSSQFPENTIPAFQSAWENKIPCVEFDFHFSKDHIPVISHDSNFERTGHNSNHIKDLLYSEIRKIDVSRERSFQAATFPPSLEEVLELVRKNKIFALAEMKAHLDLQSPLIQLLEYYRSNLQIMDFDLENLLYLKKQVPKLQFIWLIDSGKSLNQALKIAVKERILILNPNKDSLLENLGFIKNSHEKGVLVYCWTVDSIQDAVLLIEGGVDLITTNVPLQMYNKLVDREY